ncbi:MAG: carboxymuconolactone decarboxylase family protein [Geminicoccaceae bacterium]|nr:MAG: carboxymuconolactone decarboxylase family protein [Geminicoccaceae bacterium]
MATVKLLQDEELDPRAAAVFADIRTTRGTNDVNAFWRALANHPETLETLWSELKRTMAPGALDPLTKELLYVAVSVANSCAYCVHSHTAAARAKGMTDAQHQELLQVIAMAQRTNGLVTALGVPVDPAFDRNEG